MGGREDDALVLSPSLALAITPVACAAVDGTGLCLLLLALAGRLHFLPAAPPPRFSSSPHGSVVSCLGRLVGLEEKEKEEKGKGSSVSRSATSRPQPIVSPSMGGPKAACSCLSPNTPGKCDLSPMRGSLSSGVNGRRLLLLLLLLRV